MAEENRRKKLMLPQPKEEKKEHENLKEINRLRKMAPLRCEDVKIRFHLDKRCVCCRRFEHVLVRIKEHCRMRHDKFISVSSLISVSRPCFFSGSMLWDV